MVLQQSAEINKSCRVMMVGTDLDMKGGIASVVRGYREAGIFKRLGIDYFPTHTDGSKKAKIFFFVKGLISIFINICQYRIVHIHTASNWSYRRLFLIILISKLFMKKTLLHVHGGEFDQYFIRSSLFERFTIRLGFGLSDRILTVSPDWSKRLSYVCPGIQFSVLRNSVNYLERNDFFEQKKKLPRSIIFLGHINQEKGVYDLLDSIMLTGLSDKEIRVEICGTGETEKAQERAKELKIDSIVNFPGWVEGEFKASLLESAYVFVLPSYMEGLPMSMLEAMEAGVPAIVTQVGGIPDVIDNGINGFTIRAGAPLELADRIKLLIKDTECWSRMSLNARKTIENSFNINTTENELKSIYDSI